MASSSRTNNPPSIPHFHLLCMLPEYTTAFVSAAKKYNLPSTIQITHHNSSLQSLSSSVKFDCVVSPANSYGLLDGAFDDAISRAFSPANEYYALTRHAQRQLYARWRGFAPPGTCTLVDVPADFAARSRSGDRWGCRWLALCPTMRVPAVVRWDREVVYECVWSLLCALDAHNAAAAPGQRIARVLMTPLATGVGQVSAERWASQVVLAMKHYVDALADPERHSKLGWGAAGNISEEVKQTHQF